MYLLYELQFELQSKLIDNLKQELLLDNKQIFLMIQYRLSCSEEQQSYTIKPADRIKDKSTRTNVLLERKNIINPDKHHEFPLCLEKSVLNILVHPSTKRLLDTKNNSYNDSQTCTSQFSWFKVFCLT